MAKLQPKKVEDQIPTSSMADVAFLLIIYFMVTYAFAVSQGLDMAMPGQEKPPSIVDPVDSVLVEVRPDGGLEVDRRAMVLDDLLDYLAPKLAQDPAKPVIVRTLPETPYGFTVDVLDELRQGRERLKLDREISIALPTEREVRMYWPT